MVIVGVSYQFFYIGNNVIEFVNSWPHLGHILNSSQSDKEDIDRCFASLVGQINEMLCYFGNLCIDTKIKLLYSYCGSLYGAELWDLGNCDIECIAVAWRKALKRIWKLPRRTHSVIVYSLCDKWPIEDEICRRSLLFALRCRNSDSPVMSFIYNFSTKYGRMNSILNRNIHFGCCRYNLHNCDFMAMSLNSLRVSFRRLCVDNVDTWVINLLLECIMMRDNYLDLTTTGLDRSQLSHIIHSVCCD